MSNVKDTQTILEDLKKMTILTGQLSEVHEKTLKMAPFVFFDNLAKAEISHDIKTSDGSGLPGMSRVIFTLTFKDESYEPDLVEHRSNAVRNMVHTILWPEVSVSIFDSKGKALL